MHGRSNDWPSFLPLFDNQRTALMDVYHPNATFSYSSNTSIPVRARIEGYRYSKDMPHQRKQDWTRWGTSKSGGSRNLNRLAGGSVEKLVKSLHVGNEEIVKAMAELPSTKHDVAGSPEKFCIDAWPVQQGDSPQLFVTIHGQFEEGMFFRTLRSPPLNQREYCPRTVPMHHVVRPFFHPRPCA